MVTDAIDLNKPTNLTFNTFRSMITALHRRHSQIGTNERMMSDFARCNNNNRNYFHRRIRHLRCMAVDGAIVHCGSVARLMHTSDLRRMREKKVLSENICFIIRRVWIYIFNGSRCDTT